MVDWSRLGLETELNDTSNRFDSSLSDDVNYKMNKMNGWKLIANRLIRLISLHLSTVDNEANKLEKLGDLSIN